MLFHYFSDQEFEKYWLLAINYWLPVINVLINLLLILLRNILYDYQCTTKKMVVCRCPINAGNMTINAGNGFTCVCLPTQLKCRHLRVGNIIFRHLCHHPIFGYQCFVFKCRQSTSSSTTLFFHRRLQLPLIYVAPDVLRTVLPALTNVGNYFLF